MNRHERRKQEALQKKLGRQAARELIGRMTPVGKALIAKMSPEERRAFLDVSVNGLTAEQCEEALERLRGSGVPEV